MSSHFHPSWHAILFQTAAAVFPESERPYEAQGGRMPIVLCAGQTARAAGA